MHLIAIRQKNFRFLPWRKCRKFSPLHCRHGKSGEIGNNIASFAIFAFHENYFQELIVKMAMTRTPPPPPSAGQAGTDFLCTHQCLFRTDYSYIIACIRMHHVLLYCLSW